MKPVSAEALLLPFNSNTVSFLPKRVLSGPFLDVKKWWASRFHALHPCPCLPVMNVTFVCLQRSAHPSAPQLVSCVQHTCAAYLDLICLANLVHFAIVYFKVLVASMIIVIASSLTRHSGFRLPPLKLATETTKNFGDAQAKATATDP